MASLDPQWYGRHETLASELPGAALLINGKWVDGDANAPYGHVNPATGRVQKEIHLAGKDEVSHAVEAARQAFPAWRAFAANERRDCLLRVARLLSDEAAASARIGTLENGLPIVFTPTLCGTLPSEFFSYYAGWCDKILGEVVPVYPEPAFDYFVGEPYGVIGIIIPWNGPMTSIGQKVAAALAAGNCVVLKPSELAPFTALKFGQICIEAGVPAGVVNVVPGGPAAGEALVRHPGVDKVSFTGGSDTGRAVQIAAAATLKPAVLELGGKSANIVFEDADLELAAAMAVQFGVVALSGQGCLLPTRLLVQESVYDSVLERVVSIARGIVVGDPLAPGTMMGPVISEQRCHAIEEVIDRAVSDGHGRLVHGGKRLGGDLAGGYFLPPTIFAEVDNSSPLAQREIFGPVLSVLRFRSEEEAVQMANASEYGLAGYVWTRDAARVHRVAAQLEVGYVGVNGVPLVPPSTPFGGFKGSGYGREGGRAGLEEFLRYKNVHLSLSQGS